MTRPAPHIARPFPVAVSPRLLVVLLCSASALSCAGELEQEAASGTSGAPAAEVPVPPAASTGTDTTSPELPDTTDAPGPMIHPRRDPPTAGTDTAGTVRVGDATSTPADTATWTIGTAVAPPRLDAPPLPVLTALRTGAHPEYARMTVEIGAEAPGPPGYRVEYVDRPLIECGSGNQIFPVGDAWLEVRLEPAAAHTEAGQPTLGAREITVEGPLLLRVYRTCDFEGIVTLVMALSSPNPYRVLTLTDPWRIVVDVQR
jgi:hypothetical protein